MVDRTNPWGAIFILHGSIADFFHQHSPWEQKVRQVQGLPTLPEHISQHFLQAVSAPTCALKYLRRETTIVIFYTGIYTVHMTTFCLWLQGKREGSFQISPSAPTIWHRIWEVEKSGGSFASVETAGEQMEAHVQFAKILLQGFHPLSTLEKLVGRQEQRPQDQQVMGLKNVRKKPKNGFEFNFIGNINAEMQFRGRCFQQERKK